LTLWEQVHFSTLGWIILCVACFMTNLVFLGVHQYPFLHARAFSSVAKFSSLVSFPFFLLLFSLIFSKLNSKKLHR
jgi:hypothetical protein